MALEPIGNWVQIVPTPKINNFIDKISEEISQRAGVRSNTEWTIVKSWQVDDEYEDTCQYYFFHLYGINGRTDYKCSAEVFSVKRRSHKIVSFADFWSKPKNIDRGQKRLRLSTEEGILEDKQCGWRKVDESNVEKYIDQARNDLNDKSGEDAKNKWKVCKAWEYNHGSGWAGGSDYFAHITSADSDKYSVKLNVTKVPGTPITLNFIREGFKEASFKDKKVKLEFNTSWQVIQKKDVEGDLAKITNEMNDRTGEEGSNSFKVQKAWESVSGKHAWIIADDGSEYSVQYAPSFSSNAAPQIKQITTGLNEPVSEM